MGWLVAIHIGAGRYGETVSSEAQYEALLRTALGHGRQLLAEDHGQSTVTRAVRVASGVLRVLEQSDLTNCGRGSNLTAEGVVECEASVVCGQTRAVGVCAAVRGVAEPSSLARALLERSLSRDSLGEDDGVGREPPLVLVGDGARRFAQDVGLETASADCDDEKLREYHVTEAAKRQWSLWHERITNRDVDERLDTVGAICIDPDGNVAAALSSGGVLYKAPGRVGLAGCPRVGCDARNARDSHTTNGSKKRRRGVKESSYAVACTGRGEQFIRSGFVTALARKLRQPSSEIDESLRSSFDEAMEDSGGEPLEGGAMALMASRVPETRQRTRKRLRSQVESDEASGTLHSKTQTSTQTVQLGVAFTTPCMGVGYLREDTTPHVQILRQPRKNGQDLVVHVSHFAL